MTHEKLLYDYMRVRIGDSLSVAVNTTYTDIATLISLECVSSDAYMPLNVTLSLPRGTRILTTKNTSPSLRKRMVPITRLTDYFKKDFASQYYAHTMSQNPMNR